MYDIIVKDKNMQTNQTTTIQNIFRVILGLLMLMAGIGHLTFQRAEFQAQVPNWIPLSKDVVVILSGVVEILLGASMAFGAKQRINAGLALAAFYILIFPGNIAQYLNHTDAFGLDTDQKRLIRLFFQPVLVLWALWSTGALRYLMVQFSGAATVAKHFYDLQAEDIKGRTTPMDTYRGNVVMVVNTASKCGLTPQFEGLEALYKQYRSEGLVILGFPCNQFAGQEPGSADDIQEFCQLNYGVSFPMFAKVDVNGAGTHPVFAYLKAKLGGVLGSAVKWNFTKFVLDKNGNPVKRFGPTTKPEDMEATIKSLLQHDNR